MQPQYILDITTTVYLTAQHPWQNKTLHKLNLKRHVFFIMEPGQEITRNTRTAAAARFFFFQCSTPGLMTFRFFLSPKQYKVDHPVDR